jgi:hypothetical protein
MQFESGAPVCAWMIFQLMKEFCKFKFVNFLDLLQEFDSNLFEFFTLAYLEFDYQRI